MPFVPGTLKKVREITGCTENEAAKRVRKDVETIRRWESESDDALPTLAQAKDLARLYRFSAGLFLLDEVPDFVRVPDMHDFRTLPSGETRDRTSWSRNLRYLIRQMESRQEFAIDAIQRAESNYQPWVGSVDRNEVPPEQLAGRIREMLETENDDPRNLRGVEDVLKEWIRRVERLAGIFVFQTDNTKSPIEVDEMRGLSLADKYAPFIVLNSKDAQTGRIFTLFHELAHLWLGASGISASDGIEFRGPLSINERIERYCNSVAGNALMPANAFLRAWHSAGRGEDTASAEFAARYFKVSRLAAAVRARDLLVIDHGAFTHLEKEFNVNNGTDKARSTRPGGNYYATLRRNAGEKYIALVLDEFYSDSISIKEAAGLLDTRVPSLFSLAEIMGYDQ